MLQSVPHHGTGGDQTRSFVCFSFLGLGLQVFSAPQGQAGNSKKCNFDRCLATKRKALSSLPCGTGVRFNGPTHGSGPARVGVIDGRHTACVVVVVSKKTPIVGVFCASQYVTNPRLFLPLFGLS